MEKSNEGFCTNLWDRLQSLALLRHSEDNEGNPKYNRIALIDLCIYVIFLTVTTVVTMSTREINMHNLDQVIVRLFIDRTTYNEQEFELTFDELVTVGDWWSYVQTTFLLGIAEFSIMDGYRLIGVPKLRQMRVQNETCTIHGAFRNQFRTCYGKYSRDIEDVSGFLGKEYMSQSEINANRVWGRIESYYGGGYIEALSLLADENKEIFENLKNSSWIDRATRVILIEFALFNANVNLFCNAKLVAEIPPSGGIVTSSAIQPIKHSVLNEGYVDWISAFIFYGLVLYYTFDLILSVIVIGCIRFCRSMWNILDFIVVLLGNLSLIYLFWHTRYFNRILDLKDQDTSLDALCYWNMFFITAMGICVFIVWIKVIKYIKLYKTMLQFSTTLQRSAEDLLGFAVMFAIVFLAYANLSVLLFGSVHGNFRDFSTSVVSMMRMVLGDFNYAEMEETNKILAPIYFLSYILFVFFILLNMFLAIINDTYSDVKSEITHGKENYFKEYMKELLKKIKGHTTPAQRRSREENEIQESAAPPRRLTEKIDPTRKKDEDIVKSWFEIVSTPRTEEEQNKLIERVEALEQTLENLIAYMDEIQKKIDPNKAQPSDRT